MLFPQNYKRAVADLTPAETVVLVNCSLSLKPLAMRNETILPGKFDAGSFCGTAPARVLVT